MDKNTVVCSRCGNEFKLKVESVFNGVSCPHCNKKMMMDRKTKTRLKIFRYILVFIVCVTVMFLSQSLLNRSMVLGLFVIVSLMAVMYLFAQYADRLCGRLLFYTFGFNYIDYVEEEKKRK